MNEINGQIVQSSERCFLLQKTIKKYNCRQIVEIGTWRGMGSTLCVLESMSSDSEFITLESNKFFFDIATSNLEQYIKKIKLIHGTIVSCEDVLAFASNYDLDDIKKKWLTDDLNNMKSCSNVINEIFNEIDLLLLDGGEFSTYPEWNKLKNRTKIVALDDIREIKTNLIYNELSNDNSYKLIEITNEGNGFCIFIKK
jgi:hypothetical protein